MPELLPILQETGLTEAEAKTYLALLELGSTTAGPLIKKAELHRATVYDCLKRLIEKGLVNFVLKKKMKYFEAADPKIFMNLVREKEQRLESSLPQLAQLKRLSQSKQEVNVYQGIRGIRTVLENMLEDLKNNGEYLDFGVSGLFRNIMGPYWDVFQQKKQEFKVNSKVIFNELVRKNNPKLLADLKNTKYRFLPAEFPSITDTFVYKDTVVLCIWTAKPVIAVVIKNKENAEGYKKQFEFMWRFAKE